MNLRLKTFVSIQKIGDKLSISGAFGHHDIYVDPTPEVINVLSHLKDDKGLPVDGYKNNRLFSMLYEHGLLEETNNHKKTRNELFYDYIGFDFEKIRSKKILVFGAGAAGGTITYLLSQQRFTNVCSVDTDRVEQSDVDKTMVYDASDIGNYKVDAIKHRINRNFGTDVTTIKEYINSSSADKIIRRIKPDIIVYAINPDPAFKIQFNEYCVEYGIPIIHASYSYEKIICGPCVVPHKTACMKGYNEYWKSRTGNRLDYNRIYRIWRQNSIHPSISFNINYLSSVVLKDVIFCLGQRYDYVSTLNKQIIVNLLSSEITEIEMSCGYCYDECVAKCK